MSVHFETISEVGKKLRSGEITSVALTELMLERIEAHNDKLNAFITVTTYLSLQVIPDVHTSTDCLRR